MNKKRFAIGGSEGFTLIEVVLVLAIGGLIFLLAFIAFQQVSRNRRDTQRRADAGRVVAELQNFVGDSGTNGTYPSGVTSAGFAPWSVGTTPADNPTKTFFNNQMGGASFTTPNGTPYGVYASADESALNALINTVATNNTLRGNTLIYGQGMTCNGTVFQQSSGKAAVVIVLESGAAVCRSV